MKQPRVDIVIVIVALLIFIAMALTLWYGRRGQSQHGYGRLSPQSLVLKT